MNLPAFCRFYHMQPSEYWRLTAEQYVALARYMREYAAEMERRCT